MQPFGDFSGPLPWASEASPCCWLSALRVEVLQYLNCQPPVQGHMNIFWIHRSWVCEWYLFYRWKTGREKFSNLSKLRSSARFWSQEKNSLKPVYFTHLHAASQSWSHAGRTELQLLFGFLSVTAHWLVYAVLERAGLYPAWNRWLWGRKALPGPSSWWTCTEAGSRLRRHPAARMSVPPLHTATSGTDTQTLKTDLLTNLWSCENWLSKTRKNSKIVGMGFMSSSYSQGQGLSKCIHLIFIKMKLEEKTIKRSSF